MCRVVLRCSVHPEELRLDDEFKEEMNLSEGEMFSRLLRRANMGVDTWGRCGLQGKVIVFLCAPRTCR